MRSSSINNSVQYSAEEPRTIGPRTTIHHFCKDDHYSFLTELTFPPYGTKVLSFQDSQHYTEKQPQKTNNENKNEKKKKERREREEREEKSTLWYPDFP